MMEVDIYKYLGEKVRELRKKAKMSQKELAEKANVTQPQLSRFENTGEELRNAASINALLECLGHQLDCVKKKTFLPST